ncbi:MAG: hypothetical protein P1U90_00150 [Akkermansiaceae bacterium]|nr:hypothetical protein [Akkermansiaceae bacterium]
MSKFAVVKGRSVLPNPDLDGLSAIHRVPFWSFIDHDATPDSPFYFYRVRIATK